MRKIIAHVDMDAFFAAVEQRDNPCLRGKPVVIGADPKGGKGRGVVSTCSYEARKFGIFSAMPISVAYRKCPRAVFLPVDMEKYSNVSWEICNFFHNFTPKIEPVSIDEAFLDITGSYHIFGTPLKVCLLIKSGIKEKIGLTASIGLAPTKMAAKIASDLNKPDGLVEVTREKLLDFLWPLDVGKIWGLGKKSQAALNNINIKTIGELAKADLRTIKKVFGKNGETWKRLANGVDEREVETEERLKSMSNEITFDEDIHDREKIEEALIGLCEKVSNRLRYNAVKGNVITLKIRLEGFQTYTRSKTLAKATSYADTIYKMIKKLFDSFDLRNKKTRLAGVKVSNLIPETFKDSLFNDDLDKKKENIYRAIDKIKEKFGNKAIYRAGNTFRL